MKLYTNEDNFFSLKIIASSLLGKKQLELEFVSTDDKRFQAPRRLPVLELDSEFTIFSSNAACFYLYPPSPDLEKEVNEWLDWDTLKFQPLLLTDTKLETSGKIELLLQELNKVLSQKKFLVKDLLTVADVALAVSLYPIFTDDKLHASLLKELPGVTGWMSRVMNMNEIAEAARQAKVTRGVQSLQGASTACWYPALKSDSQSSGTCDISAKAVSAWQRGVGSRVKLKPPVKTVLPQKNEKNILVTSALPYVNNVPHLGNIIGCVLSADVFARYCRARNYNTLYISGTDEYGTATETKALEEKITPKEICDKYHAIHREVYDWFNIKFDYFGRTTTQAQTEVVQHLFNKCHSNGCTLVDTVDQLLCQKCDRYLADRFVEGICPDCKSDDARGDQCDACGHLINAIDLISPKCKLCSSTPVVKQSQQLFLDLPMLEEQLSEWFEKTSESWSNIARVITKAWLKDGLKPRCITRDLKWGVPVPLKNFDKKVFYVWFDAPIGYMSMSKLYTEDWLQWWQPTSDVDVKLYQFMAKDNVPFHSIMFPATLMASKEGYTILNHLYATEYLNYENGKFSKSRGIGVFGDDAKDTGIPSDIFRFYLLYMRPESQDSTFSWVDLALKNNTELLNNLGNFILRSLTFVEKFYGGVIPEVQLGEDEKQLLGYCNIELNCYITSLEKGRLRDGVKYILNISRHGNFYMQSLKPWDLLKGSDSDKAQAATAIGMLSNVVCLLASLLAPYMPATTESIAHQVNLPIEYFTIMDSFVPFLSGGHKINKPTPLFKKIEQSTVESLKQKYAGRQKSESPEKITPSGAIKGNSNKNSGPVDLDFTPAIASLEAAVQKQEKIVEDLVRTEVSNQELDPHLTALAALRQKLSDLKAPLPTTNDSTELLEAAIVKQGDLVRTLKNAGVTKDELKGHVDKLLALKSKLNGVNSSGIGGGANSGQANETKVAKKKNKKNK